MAKTQKRVHRRISAVARHAVFALAGVVSIAGCARPASSGPPSAAPARTPVANSAVARPVTEAGNTVASSAVVARVDGPGVPRIDAAMKDHLRRVFALGVRAGNRSDVFAKIGDSITESGSFLQDIGHGWFDLGPHAELAATIEYFRRTHVDRDGNDSFARPSLAAVSGWTSADALEGPAPDAVLREITAIRPAFALIMFGTNDIDRADPEQLAQNLTRIAGECESHGVIPVLSTIPRRADDGAAAARVPAFNAAVRNVALQHALPLMDLNAALEPLPRHGLGTDGIHPSAYTTDTGDVRAGDLRPEGLRYGYNVRNLLALQTLERLRAVVVSDGAPDR